MADRPASGIRWGVLGTANIAAKAFLPAMREAGGHAVVVGSRSADRGSQWAAANQVDRAGSYAGVLSEPQVQAVYIALPNDQHAYWAAAAVATGKAVLCEKPMTMDADQTRQLLSGVGSTVLLWESFVFPFHPQTALITDLVADGRIGPVAEIVSEFHFRVTQPGNIRLQAERGGGALNDVGCYPLRLARLLTGSEPIAAKGFSHSDGGPVEFDAAAIVEFPENVRLTLSAGLRRPASTYTRIIGDRGELRVSNPFHPGPSDTVELWVGGERAATWPAGSGTAFQHAVDHVQQVICGTATPRYLAVTDALPQAVAMDLVRAAIRPS